MINPKVLILDIETAPILAQVWQLFDQNVALNQVVKDWFILGWSAKWLGDPASKIMHMNQQNAKNMENDKEILKVMRKLLDVADVVITQNGKKFDIKKLYARFIINGMKPPSPFKHIDTFQIAGKFGFTSKKLEYMSKKLNKKYRKLQHKKYPGHELWSECLKGNATAWREMKKYNNHDVLATEELYQRLQAWDNTVNYGLPATGLKCKCGKGHYKSHGWVYTNTSKYRRLRCNSCGHYVKEGKNLLSTEEKQGLLKRV